VTGSFFRWSMRYAAAILFAISVLVPLLTVATSIGAFNAASNGAALSSFPYFGGAGVMITTSFLASIHNAAWPLFGAAVLWRWDRYLSAKRQEAAE